MNKQHFQGHLFSRIYKLVLFDLFMCFKMMGLGSRVISEWHMGLVQPMCNSIV